MEQLYKVVFTGQLTPEADREEIISSLNRQFGTSVEKAKKLLEAGKKVLLKQRLDRDKAEKYRQALEDMGLVVTLEAMASEPAQSGITLEPVETRNTADTDSVDQAESNPYAAPQSELEVETAGGDMIGPTRKPIGNGWRWVTRGFWHFRQNPFAWVGAMVVWAVISVVVSLIPFIGSLAVTIFSPVVLAGFMIGAEFQDRGDDFKIGHLFAGFSSNLGQLVLAGVLYLVGLILCGVAIAIMMGGMFAMLGGMGGMGEADPEMIAAVMSSPTMMLSLLVGLGLMIPVIMAYWFAPALIALEGVSAIYAMKQSFMGCLKNVLPFLLYGIIGTVLLVLGFLPLALGLLIVIPIFVASIYASFRDIYYE